MSISTYNRLRYRGKLNQSNDSRDRDFTSGKRCESIYSVPNNDR